MPNPLPLQPVNHHTVPYPTEARFATVHVSTTGGTVLVRTAGGERVETARPLSPVYNLSNQASGTNLILPLGDTEPATAVVAVTVVNDTADTTLPATVRVAVALSHLPEANQPRLLLEGPLASREAAFVHIVFQLVG